MTFKQALKEAKGDKYYYDPKTGTSKLKGADSGSR